MQQAIQMELKKHHMKRNCVTLITQVMVNKDDTAFANPTKPIGQFYTKEEANKISAEQNYVFKEDAGRGYRRVVPSPKPIKVLELNVIKKLVNGRHIVIACGGGGVPVIEKENKIMGVDAVIDKDMTSALLAADLKANVLLILTSVEEVSLNYKTKEETKIRKMSVEEAKKNIINNQFAPGSMLPKIEACNLFLTRNPKGKAIITSLTSSKKALQGKKGTLIQK